ASGSSTAGTTRRSRQRPPSSERPRAGARGFDFPDRSTGSTRRFDRMVVVMTPEATDAEIDAVAERVRANGGEAFVSRRTMRAIRAAKDAGATIVRGDVYKPRTSPYSFQGLGEQGIEILQEARREFGLPVVIEVVDLSQVAHVADVADCIRVGTRNAQNFELLKEVGLANKPVMLKRGLAMTV